MRKSEKIKKGVFRIYVSEKDALYSLKTCCKFLSGDELDYVDSSVAPWFSVLEDLYTMSGGKVIDSIQYIDIIWTGDKIQFSKKYKDVNIVYVESCNHKSSNNQLRVFKRDNIGSSDDIVIKNDSNPYPSFMECVSKFLNNAIK